MAVLFALIALVGWGTGDIMVALVARKIGNRTAVFYWLIISLILASIYVPFAGPVYDWPMFIWAAILGFGGTVGTLFYFRALETGNASIVGTVSGAFPIVVVPLSIFLFKENLTAIQFGAILLTVIGLFLCTFHFEEIKNRNLRRLLKEKSIVLSFATLLIWGIYWTLVRYPVEKIGWFWTAYPGYFFFIIMLVFKMVKNYKIKSIFKAKMLIIILLMSGLTTMANFAFNLGITYGFTAIVAPIAGSAPVLFVMISRFVFKEPLTGQQRLGILFSLAGIVLIGISSV